MLFVAIILMMLGFALWIWDLSRTTRLFNPLSLGWLGYTIFLPGCLLMVYYDDYPSDPHARTMFTWMFVSAAIGYVIGTRITKGQKLARLIPSPIKGMSTANIWFVMIACAVITAFSVFVLRSGSVRGLGRVVGAFVGSGLGGLLIMSLYGISRRRILTPGLLIYIGIILWVVLFYLSGYFSRRPILGVALVICGWTYYRYFSARSLTLKSIVVITSTLVIIFVNGFLLESRGQRIRENISVWDVTARVTLSGTLQRTIPGITVNFYAGERMVEYYSREKGWQGEGFHWGSTYACGLLFFIPRAVWPDKPSSGGQFTSAIWWNRWDYYSSVSPTPVGEAYMNFGVLGPFFVFMLGGALVRVLDRFLLLHDDNMLLRLLWLFVALDFLGQWRGDFTSMFVQPVVRVAVVYGLSWLSKVFTRKVPWSAEQWPGSIS